MAWFAGLDGYVPTPNDTQAHTPRSQSGPPDWGRTVFSNLAGGGACCQPSGEQVRAGLRQLHERSAIMNFQPARANRAFEAGRVFRRRRFVAEQERAVEFLNVDAAFLDRLEGLRVLHQAAGGFLWIAVRPVGGVFHRVRPLS